MTAHDPACGDEFAEALTTCASCGFSGPPANEAKLAGSQPGLGDQLVSYTVCSQCSSLTIKQKPHDLASYYPASYLSMSPSTQRTRWPALVLRARARSGVGLPSLTGALIERLRPWPLRKYLHGTRLRRNDPIIDIGCGAGSFLQYLQNDGFENLIGVDPFVSRLQHSPSFPIIRCSAQAIQGQFALVSLQHVLEHDPEPLELLRWAGSMVQAGGWILVRGPVAGGTVHREYGEFTYSDAPRHLFLPTLQGLRTLFDRANLRVVRMSCDNDGFEHALSEEIRRRAGGNEVSLTADERSEMVQQARAINRARRLDAADSVACLLQPKSP